MRPRRILRFATLVVVVDIVTALLAVLNSAPTARAWAWAFNLDGPLDMGVWAPVLLLARGLISRMVHRAQ